MRKLVGISQKIKRAWLDAALDRLVKTTDEVELRTFLDTQLQKELPGTESRAKTSGIILRVWSGNLPERNGLRDRAVALLPRITGQDRIWLHWGMTALAYPFFRDTAEVVGRLLALQDDFTTAQVQGRLLTSWGDRATTKEAAQKLVTTLVDWEVLRSTKTKGHFLLARKMTGSISDLQLWLLEALLAASATDEIGAQQLLRLPELFPFNINVGVADLRSHDGFNIHRQGLDMDMVTLRKVKLEPTKVATKLKRRKPDKSDGLSLFDGQTEHVASSNGRPESVPVFPVAPQGEDDHRSGEGERRRMNIDRRWLVLNRTKVQECMLGLDEVGTILPKSDQSAIWPLYGLLVGVIFSLWRAVFLIRTDQQFEKEMAKAAELLGILIETNAIGFTQDVRTTHWMAGYYINNAALRLHALTLLPATRTLLRPETVSFLRKSMDPKVINTHYLLNLDAAWEETFIAFDRVFEELRTLIGEGGADKKAANFEKVFKKLAPSKREASSAKKNSG